MAGSIANRVLFPMRLLRLFIDEVGNSDLNGAANDPNVRYLSLTGIMTCQELHTQRFGPALTILKSSLFGILHRILSFFTGAKSCVAKARSRN